MPASTQKERAILLRNLHTQAGLFVLPNAWDAASARILEETGFPAIATTSSGVAAVFGYLDGQHLPFELLLQMVRAITRVVHIPVSVDLEAGFGSTIAEVVDNVKAIIEAGVVGINLEDTVKKPVRKLVDVAYQVELIQVLRQLAASMDVPLVINARTDVFLLAKDNPAQYVAEAIQRCNAYRQAGADCLFPIGCSNIKLISRLVQGIAGPINVLAGSETPALQELEQLGVARVSFGSGLQGTALKELITTAHELYTQKSYKRISEQALSHVELQQLFK